MTNKRSYEVPSIYRREVPTDLAGGKGRGCGEEEEKKVVATEQMASAEPTSFASRVLSLDTRQGRCDISGRFISSRNNRSRRGSSQSSDSRGIRGDSRGVGGDVDDATSVVSSARASANSDEPGSHRRRILIFFPRDRVSRSRRRRIRSFELLSSVTRAK